MELCLADGETLPKWVYPDVWPDFHGTGLKIPEFGSGLLRSLWKLLDEDHLEADLWIDVPADYSVGYSEHDHPPYMMQLAEPFLKKLIQIPEYERWKVANELAHSCLQRRPNKEEESKFKQLFKVICDFVQMAVEGKYYLLVRG